MKAASEPRPARALRVLVVDAPSKPIRAVGASELPSLFEPGDLLVVNDAATLPASIATRTARGEPVEIRLVASLAAEGAPPRFTAALLGAGDHRVRTEDRPRPPPLGEGDVLVAHGDLEAEVSHVSAISPRLVDVVFALRGRPDAAPAEIWAALYRAGRPVQYAHVPALLSLWDVQNVYASRPWAVEMPSAGRVLDASALIALRARGVRVAAVTHAAGLSSTGDPAIDACLPLPERWHVPRATADAVRETRAAGGRVIAVGTSVVRALEAASQPTGVLAPGEGITDRVLGPGTRRRVVDAILTGVHEEDTTHFSLLGAFAPRARLDEAMSRAEEEGLLAHELGDAWLVWGEPRARASVVSPASLARTRSALVESAMK
jgi:S-adenosylmethionine:tRNA ribosyltransferase-isomerase